MAKSEEMKIEELKRLLRRLDKALPSAPPAPQAASDLAPLQFETKNNAQLPVVPLVRSTAPHPSAAYRERAPAHAPPSSMRTILLAAGVSAAVSGSVAFVLFNNGAQPPRVAAEAPSLSSEPAKQPSPVPPAEAAPAPPPVEPVPVPLVAKRVAAAALQIDKPEATEIAAVPVPAETQPLETGSAAQSEPPKEVIAAQTVPEPLPTPADRTDNPTLAALDASQFLRRGLTMLDSGNVSAAQLLLERAAELGNGQAAFALATTYDGAPGAPRSGSTVRPNVELALRWYERAQELGIEDARKRLGELKGGVSGG